MSKASTLERLGLKKQRQERTRAILEREHRQLSRLERIIDVLYALAIWRTVTVLPHPSPEQVEAAGGALRALLADAQSFAMPLVGIALVLIYWGQNNRLFGNLERTDNFHAMTAIIQVAFVMMFGYFIRIGLELGDLPEILAAQSVALVIAGGMAILGWRHALRDGHLVSAALGRNEARTLSITNFVEPTVAALTIPLAWLGPDPYTLGFILGMPVVGWALNRYAATRATLADDLPEDQQIDPA